MTITQDDLALVRELDEKATKGPWRHEELWRPSISGVRHTGDRMNAQGDVFWGYSIHGCNEHGAWILPTLGAVHNFSAQCDANARFIAAARDLLPRIAKDYETVKAERDALLERVAVLEAELRECSPKHRKHYHVAHYEDGKLTRDCDLCGRDLTDDLHITEAQRFQSVTAALAKEGE